MNSQLHPWEGVSSMYQTKLMQSDCLCSIKYPPRDKKEVYLKCLKWGYVRQNLPYE